MFWRACCSAPVRSWWSRVLSLILAIRARLRLEAYSLASRLSLFLWNAAPDDELLQAAQTGDLMTARGRRRAVERMLGSPRFEAGVRAFFDDMLGLDATRTLAKDNLIYPAFTSITAQDSREADIAHHRGSRADPRRLTIEICSPPVTRSSRPHSRPFIRCLRVPDGQRSTFLPAARARDY